MIRVLAVIFFGPFLVQQSFTQGETTLDKGLASQITTLKQELKEERQKSAFLLAFHTRNFQALKEMESSFINSVRIGELNDPPLLHAVRNGDLQMIRFIIRSGADLAARNDIGVCPVITANEYQNPAFMITIADELSLLIPTCVSVDPLFNKEYNQLAQDVKNKIESLPLVPPNAKIGFIHNHYGWNILHYSVFVNNHTYARRLLENGYKADSEMLSIAINNADQEMVYLLTEKGATLPTKVSERMFCLNWAFKNNIRLPTNAFAYEKLISNLYLGDMLQLEKALNVNRETLKH